MARIDPRTARSRGFVEPERRPGVALQIVLFFWFLIRFAVAAGLSAAFAGLVALVWFGFTMEDAPASEDKTDAIVVLTGGEERLETAYALLQRGLAPRLFVTGVDRKVTKPEILKRLGDPPAELAQRIELGFRAPDTRGNATETAAWFNSQNMKSLRLVTANYHMRRSTLLFRRALPEAAIVTHPVVPKGLARQCGKASAGRAGAACQEWWAHREGAKVVARELAKFIAAIFYISLG